MSNSWADYLSKETIQTMSDSWTDFSELPSWWVKQSKLVEMDDRKVDFKSADESETCYLLETLPREVRDTIWRLIFKSPCGIMPMPVYWTESRNYSPFSQVKPVQMRHFGYLHDVLHEVSGKGWPEVRLYHPKCSREELDEVRVLLDFWRGPYYLGPGAAPATKSTSTIIISITEPTTLEKRLIEERHKKLPLTVVKDDYTQTGCDVMRRGNYGVQIVSRGSVQMPRLLRSSGWRWCRFALFQTCKQIASECAQVFYGENVFAFDTSRYVPGFKEGNTSELKHFPHLIPGFPSPNGTNQNPAMIEKNINRIFASGAFKIRPKFVERDTLLAFMHRIGRVNTSMLTKIKLEGTMKTISTENGCPVDPKLWPIGFGTILPILTTVLKSACPNLQSLTLHMHDKDDQQRLDHLDKFSWDDDPFNRNPKANESKIDEIVERVVHDLPTLQHLQLGGHESFILKNIKGEELEYVDEWGKAARWM